MSDFAINVHCHVNGSQVELTGHPMMRLLDALRRELHLTGTKEGCGEGECGACSIMLDGRLVNSCLVPLAHADGASITTIEGIADGDRLHRVQEAFIRCGAAQCGICTPGMVLAAVDLLQRVPHPTDADIRTGLSGNLCRCTGYMRIFEAVMSACAAEPEGPALPGGVGAAGSEGPALPGGVGAAGSEGPALPGGVGAAGSEGPALPGRPGSLDPGRRQ